MQKKKKDWETLRDTGMLGAYQPEEVFLQELPSGEILPLFSDTELWEYPGQLVRKREKMCIRDRSHRHTDSCYTDPRIHHTDESGNHQKNADS